MSIHDFIAQNRIDEALTLIAEKFPSDALLLQARYNNGKKQYNMGMIEFKDWNLILSQITNAALDLASKMTTVVVVNQQTTNNIYIIGSKLPANELGKCNAIFRGLQQMLDDREFPISEIKEAIMFIDDLLGEKDFIDSYEATFETRKYRENTAAHQLSLREQFVQTLIKSSGTISETVRKMVEIKQSSTSWREAWDLFLNDMTPDRFANASQKIDERLTSAIFTDKQRTQWAELTADANNVEPGMLWKFTFKNAYLGDLKLWISQNMK